MQKSNWEVEIWAEDEDFRLPRDDRARERVHVTYVSAQNASEAKQLALSDPKIQQRWPRANAAAFPVMK
jgi:hypothetical protein